MSTVVDKRTANLLDATRSRTGLSISEQVRLALTEWLDRLGWPTSRDSNGALRQNGTDGTGGGDREL